MNVLYRMCYKTGVVFFLLLAPSLCLAKISLIYFPLVNDTRDSLTEWISTAVPETFFRISRDLSQMQAWEPLFLFQVDSSSYRMNSDSVLMIHKNRWGWDGAIGGTYRTGAESLWIKLVLFTANDREKKRTEFSSKGKISQFHEVCRSAYLSVLPALCPLSKGDSLLIRKIPAMDFKAYATYAAAYGLEMRGNFSGALTAYSRALEIDSRCAGALINSARIYRSAGDIITARILYDKAASQFPRDPWVSAEVADFYVECTLPEEAVKFTDSKRELLIQSSTGLKTLGKANILSGEYQRAVSLLTRSVAAGVSDLEPSFTLGMAYLMSGEYNTAIDAFNQLIKYRPDYMRYYSILGSAYRKSDKLMESMMVLESARKISPENTMILNDLAHTYFDLKWYDKAGQLLKKANEIQPKNALFLVNLGVVYWHQGKIDDAKKIFSSAAKSELTRQSSFNNMANLFYMGGSTGKAINYYKKADKSGRRNETVLYNLGYAYLSTKNAKKAYKCFEEVLRLSPSRLDVLVLQTQLAGKLGKPADMELYFRKIIDILPYHETAIRGLVSLLVGQKRFEEALKPVEAYLLHFPNSKDFLVLLADIYQKMGWYEVAMMKYQFIIRDFPKEPDGYAGAGMCMLDMIRYKGSRDYDNAIYLLTQAANLDRKSPDADIAAGDIYMEYKGYRDLAVECWNKALAKAGSEEQKKAIRKKIEAAR